MQIISNDSYKFRCRKIKIVNVVFLSFLGLTFVTNLSPIVISIAFT